MKSSINLFEPSLFNQSKTYLKNCIKKNEISTHSSNIIEKFEKKISTLSGSKYSVGVNSGSVALYLSFKALGIKENDLVIMPSYSFIATATAAIHAGGSPWFVDIEKNYLTLDLNQVAKILQKNTFKKGKYYFHKKTKQRLFAICPVYTLGFLPDLIKIKKIAEKFNLKIIADAACALGAKFKKNELAKYNDAVCYSFNGNKSFTAGGGGAISLNNKKIKDKLFLYSTNGKVGDYLHKYIGHNFRITGLHAALGLGQLSNFSKIKKRRKKIQKQYISFFQKNNLKTFYAKKDTDIIQWFNFFVCKNPKEKEKIIKKMNKFRINLKNFWRPLHLQPCLKDYLKTDLINTSQVWNKILVLPSSNNIKLKDLKFIKKKLLSLI